MRYAVQLECTCAAPADFSRFARSTRLRPCCTARSLLFCRGSPFSCSLPPFSTSLNLTLTHLRALTHTNTHTDQLPPTPYLSCHAFATQAKLGRHTDCSAAKVATIRYIPKTLLHAQAPAANLTYHTDAPYIPQTFVVPF